MHTRIQKTVLLISIGTLWITPAAFAANIIFDMNGVLTTQSKVELVKHFHVGFLRFMNPFGGFFNPLTIEEKLFDYLERVKPYDGSTPIASHKNKYRLPQIMCDWLAGTVSSQEILRIVNKKLDEIAKTTDSSGKIAFIRSIAQMMFEPRLLARMIVLVPDGVKLAEKCYNQKNQFGQRAHKLFLLTNWDAESFAILCENPEIKKLLALFDGIIVSGEVHLIKPDPAIFEYAFEQWHIDPQIELTAYIDDEKQNIKGAQSTSKRMLHCIQCNNFDYKAVKKQLKRLGIFSSKQ